MQRICVAMRRPLLIHYRQHLNTGSPVVFPIKKSDGMKVGKLPEVQDREEQKSTRIHRAACACPTQHYGHRSRNGSDCRARRAISFPRRVHEQVNNARKQSQRTRENIRQNRQVRTPPITRPTPRNTAALIEIRPVTNGRRAVRNIFPSRSRSSTSLRAAVPRQPNRYRLLCGQGSAMKNDPWPGTRRTTMSVLPRS